MSDLWYRLVNNQPEGPHTLADLQRMANDGTLNPADSISQEGGTWRTAGAFPEIRFSTSPPHSLNYPAPAQGEVQVTPRVFDLLRQTSRWVRIMSVILFISCGFMVLGGGCMALTSLLPVPRPPGFNTALLGLAYIPFGLLYLAPAIYLHRYASRAKAFVRMRAEQQLEEAIDAQKSFWKFCAILALIIIAAYVIAIPIFIISIILFHR
jgi:hypothetical protein